MSRLYIRFSWITLVLIFLVILAGSVVRSTGSGMGCPDWPKCFGQWVPPTCTCDFPDDYKEIYSEKRKRKITKFASFLTSIGFEETAEELRTDKSLLVEEDFNAARTWTEYVNRLVGALSGLAVFILFIWTFVKYRSNRQLVLLALLNIILMGVEGFLGSLVVATNLVPWTITIHMLLALIIVGIQIKIIRIAKDRSFQLKIPRLFKNLFYVSLALTFIQIVLGAQVRQEVDFMVKDGVDRSLWVDGAGGIFLLHRSFSWLLLIINVVLLWMNKKENYGMQFLNYIVGLLLLLFLTGVLFSYAGMPAFIQPVHLLVATILLGIQFYSLDYFKYKRDSMIR